MYFLIAGISFLLRPKAGYHCPSIQYLFESVREDFETQFEGKTIAKKGMKRETDIDHQCPYSWAKKGNDCVH